MNLTSTSKFVSLILRHKPETIGIQLDEHGWANVDELIAGISKTREFNREMLEEIDIHFFLSKNGVWLTKEVPVKYLIKEEQ